MQFSDYEADIKEALQIVNSEAIDNRELDGYTLVPGFFNEEI